ncbi:hypothetical protein PanWU01x14_349680 [Parasponia andersonii]|uniref:Uncharacterized protein n=1 Tax=Parasponia andersonii TaxID=3476 RepID=A0A2P5AB73_PARAD|nr:hypothetical protein PanWU01x14_349680 [Parasponia andersonii]
MALMLTNNELLRMEREFLETNKERSAMESKEDLLRMQRQLSEIVSHNKTIRKKIERLEKLKDGLFLKGAKQEMWAIEGGTRQVIMTMKNLKTEEEFKRYKATMERIEKGGQALSKYLDEFEEKFMKYNIPALSDSKDTRHDVEKLKEFMRIWKEEARKGRDKGEKSLMEWLQQLHQSGQEERKTTFEEMKAVAVKLGVQISHHLVEYFLLMSVSAERDDMKQKLVHVGIILQCLGVEENSIVIERFLSVVELVDRTMRESEQCPTDCVSRNETTEKEEKASVNEAEMEVFGLILREVLRLEVALCCPDLFMKLIDQVYLSMGSHLMMVFQNKLKKVTLKINELKMNVSPIRDQDGDLKTLNLLKEELDRGIKEIWNSLDL